MALRIVGKLDKKASSAANNEFYQRHPDLVRNGKRVPLSASDPKQACLRQEWLALYKKHGGRVAEIKPSSQKAGSLKQICNLASLEVIVVFKPDPAPVKGALVTVEGPSKVSEQTDAQGKISFDALPPGNYKVTAKYQTTHALVEAARKKIGSTAWVLSKKKAPYPMGANKCNLFVYDIATSSGYTIPKRTRFSYRRLKTVWYPPLAGEWASSQVTVGSWKVVKSPLPGDIAAEAINYSDATGHVGI
ncbi:MAG: carboxypeptidase regulatory-like domain-containing protein, partial [Desulfobulbaceae bacterium]|nr:carboxypeptidase regulatory-like domain-containing protein [Desulfobulbaceae bacterium]